MSGRLTRWLSFARELNPLRACLGTTTAAGSGDTGRIPNPLASGPAPANDNLSFLVYCDVSNNVLAEYATWADADQHRARLERLNPDGRLRVYFCDFEVEA